MESMYFIIASLTFLPLASGAVELVSDDGGRAVVATCGGRVISWEQKTGGEVFAMAWPYSQCKRGVQIHGGLPLYWPWFVFEGPEGCRIHGVTSYAEWKVKECSKSRVVLELDDNDETRAAWPHNRSDLRRQHQDRGVELGRRVREEVWPGDRPRLCAALRVP